MEVDSYPILANKTGESLYSFLALEPGTRALFAESQTGLSNEFFINGYEAEIIAGKYVIWSPVLQNVGMATFWIWDTSAWDYDTTWGFPE
jgi:hypothetical protein